MASAETEMAPERATTVMHQQLGRILTNLGQLMPRQQPEVKDGAPVMNADGSPKMQVVNPLMDLLRKRGIKAFIPRLSTILTGDVLPAITETIMAVGAGVADLDARIDAMEAHPFLQIATMEDFNDPEKLDAFLAMVVEAVSEQVNLLDPDDERMTRDEWLLKMCDRMRLGLSLGYEDESESDEEDEDDAEGSTDPDDGGSEAEPTTTTTAEAGEGEGEAEADTGASETTEAEAPEADATGGDDADQRRP